MASIPAGMSEATFNYVLAFTIAHEGKVNFMYNNWPLKNKNKDVTVGIGLAVFSEDQAAGPAIRNLFKVKATNASASPEDMKKEFRRVFATARTETNLYSEFRDKSPLTMDEAGVLGSMRLAMLTFWDAKGQAFPDFASMPAQAQVALMSYNYGRRLFAAPAMCKAVRAGDYEKAAAESKITGWDPKKNTGHRNLFLNAAALDGTDDVDKLPPIGGPFPPPLESDSE